MVSRSVREARNQIAEGGVGYAPYTDLKCLLLALPPDTPARQRDRPLVQILIRMCPSQITLTRTWLYLRNVRVPSVLGTSPTNNPARFLSSQKDTNHPSLQTPSLLSPYTSEVIHYRSTQPLAYYPFRASQRLLLTGPLCITFFRGK